MHTQSAIQLRDAFLKGEISAVKIAEQFLKRIESHNSKINAFTTSLAARVLPKAELLDRKRARGERLGKLAAIPTAIKDNIHIEGELTTCASKILHNYRAPFSATAVQLLEQEDALLIGKTNLDEFAMGSSTENSSHGKTHNPWNLNTVPGGSSGGSAAAVAARMSLLALGSDTGGSVRQPAAFCGIVGYKPTYGRVSRWGLVAYGSSLDQISPFATNVADTALCMEVIGKQCARDATSLELPQEAYPLTKKLPENTVIGVPWKFLEDLNPEAKANFEASIETMKSLGAKIVEVNLDILKYAISVYYILATAEASTNLARFDGIRYGHRAHGAKTLEQIYEMSRGEGFSYEVKKRIMLGTYVLSAGFQDAYYKKAQKVRTLILDAFEAAYDMCDAIMIPVAIGGAYEHGAVQDPVQMWLQDIFTVPANLAGVPAISVPSGYDQRGLPMGVQILGPQMCDVSVMHLAYAFEQATKHARVPEGYGS